MDSTTAVHFPQRGYGTLMRRFFIILVSACASVGAADLILSSLAKTIGQKRVTYDFHRLMDGATLLKCSEFGDNIIAHM